MPFAIVDNIVQWAGSLLSPASSAAAVGTENAPVFREIPRVYGQLLTNTPLGANAVYTSPWFDRNQSGAMMVEVTALTNTTSGFGYLIQESDDQVNVHNITVSNTGAFGTAIQIAANTLNTIYAQPKQRYWQVKFTGGATSSTLSLYSTETSVPFLPSSLASGANSPSIGAAPTIIAGFSVAATPDGSSGQTFLNMAGAAIVPAVLSTFVTGGGANPLVVAARTPNIFRGAQFSTAGSNTVWQPPSTKKSRLMKYKVEVSADATLTGGAAPINLQFNQQLGTAVASLLPYASTIPYTHRLVVPGSSASSFLGYDSGWIDLGNGVLGPTAGRALQMGIQVPQSTAAISSPTWTIASNQWEAATVGFKTSGNTGAFKLVQTSSNAAAASSVALPALQMVTGNSYFVFFRTTNPAGGAPTVVVTDTALNTYTTGTLVTNASDGANGSSLGVAYIINAAGNAANIITVTTSVNLSTVVSAIVIEYAGLGSGGIDAAQVGTTGNSTSPASGAYTPTTVGDVVFTFMATAATLAAIPTAPAAFTLRGVPFTFVTGGLAVADNFGNGSLATGQINLICIGTEE